MFECVGFLPCKTKTGKLAFCIWGVSCDQMTSPAQGRRVFEEFVFENQINSGAPQVGQVFEVRWGQRQNPRTGHSYVERIEF